MPDPERRRGHHRHPLVGRRLESTDQVVGGTGVGEQVEAAVGITVDQHVGRTTEQLGHLGEHDRGLLSRSPQRRRRHGSRRHQGYRAADQCVGPSGQRGTRAGHQRGHEDRLDGSLVDEEVAGVQEHRRRHGQAHHEADLPGARAEVQHEQVAQEDPDRDTGAHLDHAPQPLGVRRAERDDRRDRREDRHVVAEQVLGDQPRDASRECALCDLPALGAEATQALAQRRATSAPGPLCPINAGRLHVSIVPE